MSKAATVYLLQEEDTDLFETPNDFLTSPALAIGFRVAILCFVVLWLALAVLDLRRRRAPGDGAVLLGGRSPARAIFGNFDLPHCPSAGVPTRLPGTRAGGRCAREGAQAAGQPVSQVSVDCGEGVPTLPRVWLGSQKALRELPKAVTFGLEYLSILRHGAERKERQLVGG